jgi:hypothetical protein
MPQSKSRREFIGKLSAAGFAYYFGLPQHISPDISELVAAEEEEKLFDWSEWEKYRGKVSHPCLTIRKSDLEFARENIRRYGWARDYASRSENKARHYLDLATPDSLLNMIEEATPGDPLWTPCPSCRDQNKPVHPHGIWKWEVEKPDQLQCKICGEVFPHEDYPENIVFHTKWRKSHTISYYGGETFTVFGYKKARPSFSANIRSRKVQWMANYCHTLAEAYALTGNELYATTTKAILLRFADCYPNWLVHEGYGEYADMDPRIAAQNMNNLPEPEICPPPNKPDNSLWTGFWSAGRASGVGLESDFIRKVVLAYDLTCGNTDQSGKSIYSEEEKKKIERDLLLESTILLVCDKKINNKSVSNRTAVGLVGMCVGHPGLVRFGLDGFDKTINEWYLSDGTTSETPFYGLMTLGGIWDMAQAARNYSDPSGYQDSDGKRLDNLDLYHNTNYHLVLDSFFKGLQGDLRYPPYADSFRTTNLDLAYVELMVANFPSRIEYLALLKEICGSDLSRHTGSGMKRKLVGGKEIDDEVVLKLPYDLTKPAGYPSFSLYYRKPGLEDKASPELKLPDWCPEELRIGHLRTGNNGRESLLLMSASHWGIHHELDSLNLYYWKKGAEILSDLGYLWDHPQKYQNMRTLAHNTVLIDEKDQVKKNRGGEVLFFETFDNVKAMEMTSQAYPEAKRYRRTSAIIEHGNGRNYVVDFFRVEGGETQDFVFHAVDNKCNTHGIDLTVSHEMKLYDFKNIRSGDGGAAWRTSWKGEKGMNCVAWSAGQRDEQVFVADGWGQRDWENSDIGATIPYVVRRCRGKGEKLFVSVFEGYEDTQPFVRDVKMINDTGTIEVKTAIGTDYIMSMAESGTFKKGRGAAGINLVGHFAAASVQNNRLAWSTEIS